MSALREPLEIVERALARDLVDEDGERIELTLLPGLTDHEIHAFRAELPMPLPAHVERLLRACRGIDGTAVEPLDFTGRSTLFEFIEVFPHGMSIAGDGYGNHWVVDLLPTSADFGPVYYACHDPPIVLYQSPTLADFLEELFKMSNPPHASLVDDVREDRLNRVWLKQPGLIAHAAALASPDPVLLDFAGQLADSYVLVDLRAAKPGEGFAWGRYEPETIKRCGALPIFALEPPRKRGLLSRLFGG